MLFLPPIDWMVIAVFQYLIKVAHSVDETNIGQSFWVMAILVTFTAKYMVMSRDRNAGRGHSVKIDNSSIERVEEFNIWEWR